MERVRVPPNVFLPMPVVLVGSRLGGRANFMPAGWVCRANLAPPILCCGISRAHATPLAIRETGTFSVNVPSADALVATDYCGIVSGAATDKSGVFEVIYGELGSAPMIADCPIAMECRVVEIVSLPSHDLVIGEIVAAYADPSIVADGRIDITAADPLLLTMPDNTYRSLGRERGRAWSAGLALKEEREG
jgi:flavin reductase (DIM6/NTAB) family NADH-FMN oxidoreductase RutF